MEESVAKPKLLLVDDDPIISDTLSFVLQEDFDVAVAQSREEAKEIVARSPVAFHLALVDLGLPPVPHTPEEGFNLVRELLANNTHMRVLVLSGQNDKSNINHAMTLGAVDFIPKPCDPALLKTRLEHQVMLLDAEAIEPSNGSGVELIGSSAVMADLALHINQYADSPFPVLIEGESGSGKELVAQQLHEKGQRSSQPYYVINCAAFTKELLESQLFGHAKGSFTGANKDHSGFFEAVGEGTLFMDEVGELPLELQAKLLRVLESGEFYRLGETKPRISQARIVAATNKDMRAEVKEGHFRQDLYHRLGILSIKVPPLRARGNDRSELLEHIQQQLVATVPQFSLASETQEIWDNYRFSGNVRELRNLVIRLGTKYPGSEIQPEQLLAEIEADEEVQTTGSVNPSEILREGEYDLDTYLRGIEKEFIEAAVDQCDGNLSKVAKLLQMNRTTLYSRMERLGLK